MSVETPRRLSLAEIGPRRFEITEAAAAYRLQAAGVGITFEIDRLIWHRHELSGELVVRCDFAGTDAVDEHGTISVARLNVSSARARTAHATQLERQSRASDVPWHPLVEDLCQRVLAAERSGEPAIALCDVERQDEDERRIYAAGFVLPWRHPSIIFGDGGTAKSYIALYLGGLLAQEGHRVLLCDWELDAADHRERFGRLFGTDMPATLFYTRCTRPLVYDADRLKRIVRTQQIDFGIFDSVAFACHEAPETAEAALTYFRSARTLGIGGLHVAHVAKGADADGKPFGSTFHFNSCRGCWNIKATEDGAGNLTIGVFDRKPSVRARQQAFALGVTFTADRTTIRPVEIADVQEFAPQLSLYQRVRVLLKGGAKTRDEIAEALDCKTDTLRKTLNRALDKGHLVQFPGPNGITQIGLPARAS